MPTGDPATWIHLEDIPPPPEVTKIAEEGSEFVLGQVELKNETLVVPDLDGALSTGPGSE